MMSNQKGTILVVDDDRLVLATLAHGLSQAGYDVIDADNGDDAILLARENHPELALLDIRMQGKSGFDVAAYLRDHCRIPFMFLSAFSDEQTAQPVVDAALADLAARRPGPVAAPRDAASAMPSPEVLMAIGVLMHRHSLIRATAYERLSRMAGAERITLDEQAKRLLEAVELLALPAVA